MHDVTTSSWVNDFRGLQNSVWSFHATIPPSKVFLQRQIWTNNCVSSKPIITTPGCLQKSEQKQKKKQKTRSPAELYEYSRNDIGDTPP